VAWGLNSEIVGNHDDFLKFNTMAESFVTGNYNDEFWLNAPRNLFMEFARSLHVSGKLNNKTFADSILKMDMVRLRKELQNTYAASLVGRDVEKTTTNMIMTLVNAISGFRYLKRDAKQLFSISKWFQAIDRGSDSWIFICPGNTSYLANAKQLYTGWLDLCASYGFSLIEDTTKARRIHYVFDEADTLNKLPALLSLLLRGRSFGLCVTLGFQNVAQAIDLYGENLFRTIIGNCNNMLIFNPGNDQKSSEYLSGLFDTMEVEEVQESESYAPDDSKKITKTRSVVRKEKPVIKPDDFKRLEVFECYLKMANRNPVKLKFEYFDQANIAVGLQPRDLNYLFDEYKGGGKEVVGEIEANSDGTATPSTPFQEEDLKIIVDALMASGQSLEVISKRINVPLEVIMNLT
jgi:type IV secretory pathway TraG/TraD family ATPase VirD4